MGIPSTLPTRGLVFKARLDGNTVANSATGVITETASSLTYTPTPRGMQAQYGVFDGSSRFASYPVLADSNTYHIFAHVRFASIETVQRIFFDGDTAGGKDFHFFNNTNGSLAFTTKDDTTLTSSASVVTTGLNYLLEIQATTANGGSKKIFINGVEIASVTGCTNVNTWNHAGLQIGRLNDGGTPSSYMNGNIGLVAFHNVLLTDSERQAYLRDFYRNASGYGALPLMDGLTFWISYINWVPLNDISASAISHTGYTGATANNAGFANQAITTTNQATAWVVVTASEGTSWTGDFAYEAGIYITQPAAGNYPWLFMSFRASWFWPMVFLDPFAVANPGAGDKVIFRIDSTQLSSSRSASSLYNGWHHFLLTRVSGDFRLYIDGVNEWWATNNLNIPAPTDFYVGRSNSTQQADAAGFRRDMFRCYRNTGKTAAQAKELYELWRKTAPHYPF